MSIQLKAAAVIALVIIAACTTRTNPGAPSPAASLSSHGSHDTTNTPNSHNAGAHEEHGLVDGWYEGQTVKLFYTKSFFCEEPPSSAVPTNCELGAPAEVTPRPGPIPIIYAIAAAGGIPAPQSTLACFAGVPCFNHPGMIDASRVLGPNFSSVGPVPHNHIVTERRSGWHRTINIRVREIGRWNQIAEAKTLAKVRELQADGSGLVSPDTPTNIFFFIASWQQ